MSQQIRILGILVLFLAIGSVSFALKWASTWTPPTAMAVDFSGKKVVVLVLGRNLEKVLPAEEQLAKEITARGAQAIGGHTLIPEGLIGDKDAMKTILEKEGVAGAVVIRAWIKGQQAAGPNTDRGFWDFYGESLKTGQDAGNISSNPNLYVEVRVYSIAQNALIWTGSTGTKVSDLEKFIQELVPEIAEQMKKQNLLKQ